MSDFKKYYVTIASDDKNFIDNLAEAITPCDETVVRTNINDELAESFAGRSFAGALTALKMGHKVARTGWNGKGMFVYYVAGGNYPAQMEAIKGQFENDLVPYVPYLAMKTADNKVVPWLISQTDALADDWQIVE